MIEAVQPCHIQQQGGKIGSETRVNRAVGTKKFGRELLSGYSELEGQYSNRKIIKVRGKLEGSRVKHKCLKGLKGSEFDFQIQVPCNRQVKQPASILGLVPYI
jgi:hypothetical protein